MTFTADCKPHFDLHLPNNSQQGHDPAIKQEEQTCKRYVCPAHTFDLGIYASLVQTQLNIGQSLNRIGGLSE